MKFKSILLAIVLVPILSFSQKTNFSIGGEYGANLSRIDGLTDYYHDNINGIILGREFTNITGEIRGLIGQIHFNKFLSIQTGYYYEEKGVNYKYYVIEDPTNSEWQYREYVYKIKSRVLPLMIRAQYGGQKLQGFINIGGYAAYIKNFLHYTHVPKSSVFSDFMLEDGWFKRFEYGVTGGLGFSYKIKQNISLSFEVRTNYGLRDIKDGFFAPGTESESFKLRNINFLFGVTHHLTTYSKSKKTDEEGKQ